MEVDPFATSTKYQFSFRPFKTIEMPEHALLILPVNAPSRPNGSFMLFLKERLTEIRNEHDGVVPVEEATSHL